MHQAARAGDRQPISLSLDCNEAKGKPMFSWLAASTPPVFSSCNRITKTWAPGLTPSYQGPCVQLSDLGITELPFVPVNGPVDIYFAVDGVQNGVLDPRSLAGDAVRASMPRQAPNRIVEVLTEGLA